MWTAVSSSQGSARRRSTTSWESGTCWRAWCGRLPSSSQPRAAWPLTDDPSILPAGLPVPVDDGAAAHLPGLRLPDGLLLASTGRQPLDLAERSARRRTVVFAYPRTGRPGEAPLVPEWDLIPGARGCTPEACAFRDL